jgi:large subunit ribosomal protein L32e
MKRHPRFKRPDVDRFARLKDVWRKPRGIDSKQRIGFRYAGAKPSIGYRTPKKTRGMRFGALEVLVSNARDVEKAAQLKEQGKAEVTLRITRGVGSKKRTTIVEEAGKRGLKVLNP